MMNKKTIYIVIAIVLLAGAAYWYWMKKKAAANASNSNSSSNTVTGAAAVQTAQAAQPQTIVAQIVEDVIPKPVKMTTSSFNDPAKAVSGKPPMI
jgi:hypothetical protein